MKKIFLLFGIVFFFIVSIWAAEKITAYDEAIVSQDIIITPELRKKYPIKKHHEKLSLDCVHCHEGQGTDPKNFEFIGDEGCLACHKSKKRIAQRTEFMDAFHTNPHNSFHDGPTLACDECHQVHEPSINMCSECHSKEVPKWMKDVTP